VGAPAGEITFSDHYFLLMVNDPSAACGVADERGLDRGGSQLTRGPPDEMARSSQHSNPEEIPMAVSDRTKHNGSASAQRRRGIALLRDPNLNRGTAFTLEERSALGLEGLLPAGVLSLEEQAKRSYQQYDAQPTDLAKNDFLAALHDRNEVLYYKLLEDQLPEMLPVVYDPVVAQAIEGAGPFPDPSQPVRAATIRGGAPSPARRTCRGYGRARSRNRRSTASRRWNGGPLELADRRVAPATRRSVAPDRRDRDPDRRGCLRRSRCWSGRRA
jgi:hypothetical protein